MRKPKILFYDIETSPIVALTYEMYDATVAKVKKYPELLSFAWQWDGEKTIHCKTRADFKDKTQKSLLKELHALLSEADIVIAHNGISFDNKKVKGFGVKCNLPSLPRLSTIDTKREVKSHFGFVSNSLDNVAAYLDIGRKLKHAGIDLWDRCMNGEKKAFEEMRKYNKHDIYLLKRVYKRIKPHLHNHPNLFLLSGGKKTKGVIQCPDCGSQNFEARGYRATSAQIKRQLHCKVPGCDRWFLGPVK